MISYDTVTEAVKGLKERGYTLDFNLKSNCIECEGQKLSSNDFEIAEVYRFEGNSDPADESVVFAIESSNGVKGILVNAFGVYSESLSDEMIKKLNYQKN
jgi:hypothetical protein